MNITSSKQGNVAVVRISGHMDAQSSPKFEAECAACLRDGSKHIVVDMVELQYVSSGGLRSFLIAAKDAKAKGGGVLLCGMRGFVKEVFDMTHVSNVFPVFDSSEAAVASIEQVP